MTFAIGEVRSVEHRERASASLRLADAIARFPGQRFAVVDGGHFDDLPAALKKQRLFARSLFLDHADVEVEKAGPWLVSLDQEPNAGVKIMTLTGDKPAAVYWSCAGGEAVLYRHLRTLNMARIPSWAAGGASFPPPDGSRTAVEAVMFRHWDPRVLAMLLPILEAHQFSRVVGVAEEIAFVAADYGGFKRVIRDFAWPSAPPGLLTVTSDQCEALIDRRISTSQRRITDYLRQCAPSAVTGLGDDAILEIVRQRESEARGFGVLNEYSIGLWAYMQATSTVDYGKEQQVVRFMADPACGETADDRMQALFDLRTRVLNRAFG